MLEGQAISALGALAQETRLRIVRHLVRRGAEGAAAGEIGEALGAASSRLSFHLSALEKAGLVSSERVSRRIIYRADFARLGGLIAYLMEDCCGGHPAVLGCCGVAAPDR